MQHWSSSKHKGHILWRYGGAEEAEGGASEERGVVDAGGRSGGDDGREKRQDIFC